MLPQGNKLRSSRDLTVTVRRGRRVGRKTLVLHIRDTVASGGEDKTDTQTTRFGDPCVGPVVSKTVGNTVTRHTVSRKLRHVMAAIVQDLLSAMDIVVRALPASTAATSQELSHDVQSTLATYERRR